ncbi:hypothetical protein LEP1GSC050_3745 [Leptospira broomii serovar Hurstbridge str. 5399]|uniref:Uncharacterized protein n=1 Tax=Leptospira broomii serovar Hurstbridge str. 5399 TaxID=1049789 RepID=T0FBP0_9LEPT|nr:DUF5329 domain-containing protein [Leptospira broomii]EQA45291.1 hypothetical protein LEP1GSC050_3745 [Leptospira broomii serovar Hurstbridge str. 5399]
MRHHSVITILLFTLTLLPLAGIFSSQPADLETEINALLSTLDSCNGCTFIRNGSEHTVHEAKAHLLRKYEATKGRIKTTEDFIVGLASKSSITGIPYKIRFPDGKEIESEKWLMDQLTKLRKPAAPAKKNK